MDGVCCGFGGCFERSIRFVGRGVFNFLMARGEAERGEKRREEERREASRVDRGGVGRRRRSADE
jgi:hypothetical protein